MSKVKLGFIGVGFMGQLAHMQNYANINDCEIVAITEVKQKQAERVAAKYNIPHIFSNYNEMFEKVEIDAVVASQPFNNHVNIVPDVLNAGKHVLTEKPLCVYAENGKKLVEVAAKSGKIHMVGYHKRSDPATEYAIKTINEWKQDNAFGKMKYVRITMPPGDWVGGCMGAFRTDEPVASFTPEPTPEGINPEFAKRYNGFVNYYIHQVNLLRYLLGEDYKVTYADPSEVLLVAESTSGIAGIIEMATYRTSHDWQEQAMVCFEKGWIKLDLPSPLACQQAGRISIFNNSGDIGMKITPRMPNVHAMLNQARNFVKAVKGEREAPCVSSEAIKDLEVAMDYVKMLKKY